MLTEKECKNFKPEEKSYKKSDSGGLYLLINPNGSKYWRLKYRYGGKEKLAALGVYPEMSLKDARLKRDEYKKKLTEGNDPTQLKKQEKHEIRENLENTFENIALEWHKWRWGEKVTRESKNQLSRLKRHIFPFFGGIPIKNITPSDMICVIRKIEDRGTIPEARKTRGVVSQVFKYAIATQRAEHNIAAETIGACSPSEKKHYPYFSEKEFQEFLQNFSSLKGNVITKLALKFLILTFVRSGEVRGARWEEIDFDKKEWRIQANRMKMKEQHIVPLSKQTIEVLNEAKKYSGDNGLVFKSSYDVEKEMSDNTLSKALRMQGYKGKATPHGMRATASTILNERGEFRPDVIERQLAHCERNKVRASYNHAQYLPERREMMDWWGNYIENIENNGKNV